MTGNSKKRKIANDLSCQGKVIFYDRKSQKVTIEKLGGDSHLYRFVLAEWKNKDEKPKVGMIVDFEINENKTVREAVRIKIQ